MLAVLARANVGAVSCIPCYMCMHMCMHMHMCMCMCMRYVLAALAAAPWEWLNIGLSQPVCLSCVLVRINSLNSEL